MSGIYQLQVQFTFALRLKLSYLFFAMPLIKVCPKCSSVVNVRKTLCACGHSFSIRRQPQRVCKAAKRANETPVEALKRKQHDRANRAAKRASETALETLYRQECDRASKASKRAAETPVETLSRQQNDR